MAQPEAINTMVQNSYTKLADGSYAQQVASAGSVGTNPQTSGPADESGFGANSVTAPAADTLIANHQPPAGNAGELHRIEVVVWLSGAAPASADNFNMGFKFGGTLISKIPVIPAAHVPTRVEFYFKAAAGTPFAVNSIAAATAGVIYNAYITATKLVS